MTIRPVRPEDASSIVQIYAPYVDGSSVSFEYDVPSVEVMRERIRNYTEKFPWLVAEENQQVVGYAYASSYRDRKAYQWCVETSVYVEASLQGSGVARELYTELLNQLTERGFFIAYAVITHPNPASVRFHEKMGFRQFAIYRNVGFKNGSWHDVIWMEKVLNTGSPSADPVFSEVK